MPTLLLKAKRESRAFECHKLSMRADRLISILLLLQAHDRVTARELARRLEVSERTIHRDMEALGKAGIPVTAERGTGGGWSLVDGYQTRLTGLNEEEIHSLFLSSPARLLADLGLNQAAESALAKLLAALPTMYRADAEFIRQRIYVDIAGWHPKEEDISNLPALQQAIWGERKIWLHYRRSEGTIIERLVDPLGLVAKGRTWYLVAAVDADIRTYRVSRIFDVGQTDQLSVRPPDFDLVTYWQQSMTEFVASLPTYPTVLRIAPGLLPRLQAWRFARIDRVEPPDNAGWIQVQISFEIVEEACEYVLGCGTQAEVIDPPELRERVIQLAHDVVQFYSQGAVVR